MQEQCELSYDASRYLDGFSQERPSGSLLDWARSNFIIESLRAAVPGSFVFADKGYADGAFHAAALINRETVCGVNFFSGDTRFFDASQPMCIVLPDLTVCGWWNAETRIALTDAQMRPLVIEADENFRRLYGLNPKTGPRGQVQRLNIEMHFNAIGKDIDELARDLFSPMASLVEGRLRVCPCYSVYDLYPQADLPAGLPNLNNDPTNAFRAAEIVMPAPVGHDDVLDRLSAYFPEIGGSLFGSGCFAIESCLRPEAHWVHIIARQF